MRRATSPSARLLAALLALLAACAAPPSGTRGPAPVDPRASEALAEARGLWRAGAAADDAELAELLARAQALAPDWVAPLRFLDDLALASLRGVEALERRRADLAHPALGGAAEGRARAASEYLAARLEQGAGPSSFARAASLDPDLAWAQHGLAFDFARAREFVVAERHQRRALALARDPWERAFFALALARHRLERGRGASAAEELARELGAAGLGPSDRTWLAVETALVELRLSESPGRARGFERGLALLREADPAPADLARLVAALGAIGFEHDPSGRRLLLALAARPGRERELSEVLLAQRAGSPLVQGLAVRNVSRGESLTREGWFAAGRFGEGVEAWLTRLPAQVLGEHGLPRDERLAALVAAAREHARLRGTPDEAGALRDLGARMLDAGWFDEARRVADELGRFDLDSALELALRATAGAELVGALERLARKPRGDERRAEGWAQGAAPAQESWMVDGAPRPAAVDDLDALLEHLAEDVARANAFLGGEGSARAVREELLGSPRIRYGPFAQLVHPGPRFSAGDQRAGLGPEGERVPGLAALMERLGRFATFGQVLGGGGPDGVVLRRLFVEERAGEHLGVAWSGTIAWCEGADLSARASRAGARISGAAVHEGYWIDVEVLRPEHRRWRAVRRAFDAPADDAGARARLERVLASGGLSLPAADPDPERRERARRALEPLLDQADRVRLAVLAERAPADRLLGELAFEEIVEGIALHEEGHLVDRALFLPLPKNLFGAARLLLDSGLSIQKLQRRLEYRAQLVALCAAPDPRLALVDVLEIGASGGESPLEHAAAYRELLRDLVAELDRARRAEPARFGAIDPERTLVHQLHRLDPEALRSIALRLARRQGVGRA